MSEKMSEGGVKEEQRGNRPLKGNEWEFSARGTLEFFKEKTPDSPQGETRWEEHKDLSTAGEKLKLLAKNLQNLFVEGWGIKSILTEKADGNHFAIVFTNPSKSSTYSWRDQKKLESEICISLKGMSSNQQGTWFKEPPSDQEKESRGEVYARIVGSFGDFKLSEEESNRLLADIGCFTFGKFEIKRNEIRQNKDSSRKERKTRWSIQSGVVVVEGYAIPVDEALIIQKGKEEKEAEYAKRCLEITLAKIAAEGTETRRRIKLQRTPQ